MSANKPEQITSIVEYLEKSVPLDVACKAVGVSREKLTGWIAKDSSIKDKLDTAEAKAYASLIVMQHSCAQMGEQRPLQELLTKRWQIAGVAQEDLINKIIAVAERALPSEWYDKFLKAIEESEL